MLFHQKRFLSVSVLGLLVVMAALQFFQSSNQKKTTPITGGTIQRVDFPKAQTFVVNFPKASPPPPAAPNSFRTGVEVEATPVVVVVPPGLPDFIDMVRGGEADEVRGLFIEGVFALPVVQQPENDATFVSSQADVLTEFQSPRRNGVTGILAHNYLSGELFYQIEMGKDLWVVYGDGNFQQYRIVDIQSFQKLTPSSLRSDFIDLANNEKLTTSQVFNRFYNGEHKLTLQTCLARERLSNWGLTFWVAVPVE